MHVIRSLPSVLLYTQYTSTVHLLKLNTAQMRCCRHCPPHCVSSFVSIYVKYVLAKNSREVEFQHEPHSTHSPIATVADNGLAHMSADPQQSDPSELVQEQVVHEAEAAAKAMGWL